jgi:hypothetical protein
MAKATKAAKATPTTTSEAPYEGPAKDFSIDNGVISFTDENGTIEVAKYDGKEIALFEDQQDRRPSLVAWMNENKHPYESIVIDGDQPKKPKAANIPPMPKKDMRFGDKTPAVMEWYKKYHPEQYRARYGIVGPGTVTKYRREENEKGEKVSVPYEVDAILARRKTKFTEKVEAGNATDSEYNDK